MKHRHLLYGKHEQMTDNRSIFPVRDERITEYVPVKECIVSSETDAPDFFNDRKVLQSCETVGREEMLFLKSGAYMVLDFGEELAGGIRIVTGTRGGRLKIVFGESVSEALSEPESWHTIHDIVFDLPAMGVTEFGNTGFRFVRIEAETDITLLNILAVYRHLDLPQTGKFESSDEQLNRIWNTAVHTVHLCMQEHIFDGVKRDRLVWMGDLHPEISVINLIYGKTAIVNRTLDYIRDRSPLPRYMNNLSSYSMWWVICQYELYMCHADMEYLSCQHDYLKGLMSELGKNISPGGKEIFPESSRFIDWPTRGDDAAVHAGLQGLLVRSFDCALKLAVYLEDAELAAYCREKLSLLRTYTVPFTNRKAPNALLALAGLKDFRQVNKELLSIDPCRDLGTFMGFYTLLARCEAEDYAGVLDTIRKYYGAMLDCGATSFWEDFDMAWTENSFGIDRIPETGKRDIHKDCGAFCYKGLRHSLCHGWSGGVAAVMIRLFLGIDIIEPGYSKIRLGIKNHGLEYMRCSLPTPAGLIEVEMYDGSAPRITLPRKIQLSL